MPTVEPAPKRGRRSQRMRVEESSRRLLQAAVELIADQGFVRTTTGEISERAGLSNSMVHMRYGSKDALLEAFLHDYEEQAYEPIAADQSGLEQLLHQVELVHIRLRDDPQTLRAFFMVQFEIPVSIPQLKPWLITWLSRYEDHIAALIRTGQADGSIRPELDPAAEATLFLAHGIGLSYRWVANHQHVDFGALISLWLTRSRSHFASRAPEHPSSLM